MPDLPIAAGAYARELSTALLAAAAAAANFPPPGVAPSGVQQKSDGSLITAVDLSANASILGTLRSAYPHDAIVSEESEADPSRLERGRVWLVDPLDGTRDFVEGSADYAIHVALTVAGRAQVAVVLCPALGRLYAAVAGGGAACRDARGVRQLHVAPPRPLEAYRTGITRTGMHDALRRFLNRSGLGARAVRRGASVKHMLLAEGELDLCLTLHDREQEWDSCAPGLIVLEAGGLVTDADGHPLSYNRSDLRHRRGLVASAGEHHSAVVALARECFPG